MPDGESKSAFTRLHVKPGTFTNMDHAKLKAMLRRRLPPTILVQCDADTTPPEYAEHGMVCAILTWIPETAAGKKLAADLCRPPPTKEDKSTDDSDGT